MGALKMHFGLYVWGVVCDTPLVLATDKREVGDKGCCLGYQAGMHGRDDTLISDPMYSYVAMHIAWPSRMHFLHVSRMWVHLAQWVARVRWPPQSTTLLS